MINTLMSDMNFCGDGVLNRDRVHKCGKPASISWLDVWWCKACHAIWRVNWEQWQRTPHDAQVIQRRTFQETLGLPDDDFLLRKILTLGN